MHRFLAYFLLRCYGLIPSSVAYLLIFIYLMSFLLIVKAVCFQNPVATRMSKVISSRFVTEAETWESKPPQRHSNFFITGNSRVHRKSRHHSGLSGEPSSLLRFASLSPSLVSFERFSLKSVGGFLRTRVERSLAFWRASSNRAFCSPGGRSAI